VCTVVVTFGLGVGFLFLEETHEDRKYDHDRGTELGQWLLRKVCGQAAYEPLSDKDEPLDEMSAILGDDAATYRSTDSSPTLCSSRSSISDPPPFSLEKEIVKAPTIRDAFTMQTCLNIVCYGVLAL
jgi:hypothetical protein